MTRVSLREAYDNKDVVAQILSIRDTAKSAEDSAEQAVTTANTASDHVDALVPQVEGAVENANSASASAQTSAQTVASYENRLGAVETGLNNVTLRVTTAEGQIVTIQGRVTALETADGQNVKLTGDHAIGNYAVLLTGNQDIYGTKKLLGPGQPIVELTAYPIIQLNETSVGLDENGTTAGGLNFYRKGTYTGRIAETTDDNGMTTLDLMVKSNSSTANKEGRLQIYEKSDNTFGMRFWNGSTWTNLVA